MKHKLSDILAAQEKISKIGQNQLSLELCSDIKEFIDIIENFDFVNKNDLQIQYNKLIETTNQANELIDLLDSYFKTFNNFLSVEKKVSHQATLKSINDINSWQFVWQTEEEYFKHRQRWNVSKSIFREVVGIIGSHILWKYPVVYYEPHTAKLLRFLISGDPFYIIDDYKLPYENIIKSVNKETVKKIHHYTKSQTKEFLEKNSVGLCVSWQNIPFKRLGEVRKDIEIMSSITRPGGYVIFDYVDANISNVARDIENGKFMFQWRDRIVEFLNENNLKIVTEVEFTNYSPNLLVCQKQGKITDLNISNKVGLVLEKSKI